MSTVEVAEVWGEDPRTRTDPWTRTEPETWNGTDCYYVVAGRYRILRELRKTLYGSVLLGVDLRSPTDTLVAIKCSSRRQADTFMSSRNVYSMALPVFDDVQSEVRILSSLGTECGHLLELVDTFADEENYFMVCEYIPGRELIDFVLDSGPGPGPVPGESVVRDIFRQVATGVQHLHGKGIAHMDLSCENVMVRADAGTLTAKVIDFGCARQFPSPARYIPSGMVPPGRDHYVSPELYIENNADPFANDVYSLGILLYACLTRTFPYERISLREGLFPGFLSGEWMEWEVVEGLSHEVRDLIRGMTVPEPERLTIAEVLGHRWLVPAGSGRESAPKVLSEEYTM